MDQVVGVLASQRRIGRIHRALGVGAVAGRAVELVEHGLAGRQVLRLGGGARHGQGCAREGKHGAIHGVAPLI